MRCRGCGHEIRAGEPRQTAMVNEALIAERMRRPDLKDRFQIRVALSAALGRRRIVDVGSGSGRFLFHVRRYFAEHLGIEITPECLEFGRSELHLNLSPALDAANIGEPDLVTFWHSLEHLPTERMTEVLELLGASARIVVSVPNGATRFGTRSVYYDPENHVHQFTARSLDLLMSRFGFEPIRAYTGLAYSWLGNALSLVNLVTRKHNVLYFGLRRNADASRLSLMFAGGAAVIALVAAFPLYLFELLAPRRGAVLTIAYGRKLTKLSTARVRSPTSRSGD
jgi:SAM-dependent methyltransferase